MKDIGAVLKNARENKEFTQKQVMELTGINKKSLSDCCSRMDLDPGLSRCTL